MDQDWPAQSSELWPIEKITPYARNSRTHSDEQVVQIAASIREWGWTNPILVDEDGGLIAGHGRLLAARKLGLAQIPTMVGLETWRVEGPDLAALEQRLALEPGVEQVARFGAVLHISGTDKAKLEDTVERLASEGTHRWTRQVAGLEEAFIYLMAGSRDNFADAGKAAA